MVAITITGATGGLGSSVLRHLLRLSPNPSDIRISLYNPAGAPPVVQSSGVEIRKGNFKDPSSLLHAFEGTEKLLLISHPTIAHKERVDAHKNAIDAAKQVGVKHLYYTSLGFSGDSVTNVMKAHMDTEAYLKESGMDYTIIREGLYTESYALYLGWFHPQTDDVVEVPGDGGISWVTRDDLGEGTARLLLSEFPPGFNSIPAPKSIIKFTGPEILTLRQTTKLVSSIIHRELAFKIISKEEFVKKHTGMPGEELARAWSATYLGLERGECSYVDPLLKEILGRSLIHPEETLKTWINSQITKSAD